MRTTSHEACAEAAASVDAGFALLFFSQELFDAQSLASAWRRHAGHLSYAGCSTAGEITPGGLEEGQALAILLPAASFSAVSTMVRDITSSGMETIANEVEQLKLRLYGRTGKMGGGEVFALCFIDGLSYSEESVTSAIHWGLDDIPLIGGSAGDDLQFETTTLISDGVVASDCGDHRACRHRHSLPRLQDREFRADRRQAGRHRLRSRSPDRARVQRQHRGGSLRLGGRRRARPADAR